MPQMQTFLCIDEDLSTLQCLTLEVDAGTQGCSGSSKPEHWLNQNGGEQSPPFFCRKGTMQANNFLFPLSTPPSAD